MKIQELIKPANPSNAKQKPMIFLIKKFLDDESGVNGIEFAIVAPFLFLLLTGVIWITDTQRVATQTSLISSTVASVISRQDPVTEGSLESTLFVANAMMGHRANDLQIYVAGIENQIVSTNSDGTANYKPVVIWVRGRNIDDLVVPVVGSEYANVPQSLVDSVPFVVTSRARLKHTPIVGPDIIGEQVYEYEHTYAPRANIVENCDDC